MTTSSTSCSSSHASQQSQLFGVAAKHPPLKLVLTVDFDVGHNYGQHLFMNIDSRYPVRHKRLSWQERRACCGYLKQGRGLSPLPRGEDNDAQLFAQSRTLRIRQSDGLDFSMFGNRPRRSGPCLNLNSE